MLIKIRTIESPISNHIKVDGKRVINLSSNNYLNLANNSQLKRAIKQAIDRYGIAPAAVRTIAGTTSLHLALEKALAKFKMVEDVITLQSGFVANIATIPALVGEGDIIFSDELNHASIIDGCRLSKATVIRFKHADVNDLQKKVQKNKGVERKLIISDGVFSMDGDIAPVLDLYKVARSHNCLLMIDDAHGEGVLGKSGRGVVDHFNLNGKVDIEIGTLSKAFGVVGGYAAGKKNIIDWLRQRARPFLFSSAMSISDTASSLEAVRILQKSESLVKKLWENTKFFKKGMLKLGFNIGNSQTPIVPVMLGDAKLAKKFSLMLFDKGVFAQAIGYPTVPIGKARIRVMISASHTRHDLKKALKVFEEIAKNLNIIP